MIGYRTDHSQWCPIQTMREFELGLGNKWFDDSAYGGFEVIWVCHTKRDAKRYGSGIYEVNLDGATILLEDGDNGYLYGRLKLIE